MTNKSIPAIRVLETLGLGPDVDFLRIGAQTLAQALMEAECEDKVGAGRYERTPERTTSRNGHRPRVFQTRVGPLTLRIPKLRQGSYFPSWLKPRRRSERALVAVVLQAYVEGVSTRKVDSLVKALGIHGISKSQVSRIGAALDKVAETFRNRKLEAAYPYLWLDATFLKVREDGRVRSMAVVVAVGVKETGEREVLGFDLGPAEDGAFWLSFLRSLVARGLRGVQLVISDAHEGLRKAIGAVLSGATWQRCTVHFIRNVLAHVPKNAQAMVAALVRTVFAQPDIDMARRQLVQVAETVSKRFPRCAQLIEEAEADVLAYMHFPREHWRQIHSTNPLERLNKEIKRRTDVVGIFPDRGSVCRLVGALLAEQNDEWATGRRYFSQESMAKLKPAREEVHALPPMAAD